MKGDSREPYPSARFALRHPVLAALNAGLLLGGWNAFLWRSVFVGAIFGSAVFVLFLVLWFPRVGPARKWVERHKTTL